MKYFATVLGTLLFASAVLALPTGPPLQQFAQVCMLMTPAHSGIAPQPGNGGYVITTDLPFINATEGYSYVAGQNATGSYISNQLAHTFLLWLYDFIVF